MLTEREEKNSGAIASNASFSGWTRTFTDPRLCAAIVDRLTLNGAIIQTRTDSYRLAHTKAQTERAAADSMQRPHSGVVSALRRARLLSYGSSRSNDQSVHAQGETPLLRILKTDECLPTIPVVVLTTSTAPDDVAGAYSSHANACVTKPVGLEEVEQAVQSIDALYLDTATRPPRWPQSGPAGGGQTSSCLFCPGGSPASNGNPGGQRADHRRVISGALFPDPDGGALAGPPAG
ncbi:hypothetical protein Save01_03258 [Streptomyces avermitilis]|uniref:IstB-like ATP-binding domain-containing protein n=1 Tax=Streptomyces avermitilis TaxID=33903 RepID=A0A4D4MAB1_STRAX|nr:hypothetical protein SAV14893_082190 [Streptomyces avermitilis]GDY70789.1 hypothetical protein SAV31267_002740 [Streptomyces avermitilis]